MAGVPMLGFLLKRKLLKHSLCDEDIAVSTSNLESCGYLLTMKSPIYLAVLFYYYFLNYFYYGMQ